MFLTIKNDGCLLFFLREGVQVPKSRPKRDKNNNVVVEIRDDVDPNEVEIFKESGWDGQGYYYKNPNAKAQPGMKRFFKDKSPREREWRNINYWCYESAPY